MLLKYRDQCMMNYPCYPLPLCKERMLCCQKDYPWALPQSSVHPSSKNTQLTKLAASSHWQLFSASSVNVRSKVRFEIMEHVTFFSQRAEDIAPEKSEHFWWEGATKEEQSPEGEGEMSQSLPERSLAWTFRCVCVLVRKKHYPYCAIKLGNTKII